MSICSRLLFTFLLVVLGFGCGEVVDKEAAKKKELQELNDARKKEMK